MLGSKKDNQAEDAGQNLTRRLNDCCDQEIRRISYEEIDPECEDQVGGQVDHRDPIHLFDALEEPLREQHRPDDDAETGKEYGSVVVKAWDKVNQHAQDEEAHQAKAALDRHNGGVELGA